MQMQGSQLFQVLEVFRSQMDRNLRLPRKKGGGGGCTIFGCLLFFHVYRDLFLYMGICYSICGLIVSGILLYPTQIYIGIKMENIYCIKKQRSLMH